MITPVGICPGNASRTVFEREGFLGPLPVLTTWQRELLVRHLNRGAHVAPAVWEKGRATRDYLFYDIATQPEILGILRLLLGENVILWGASVVSRQPGQIHPWHTDIETSRADMRSVSVWIGIENTSQDLSLHLISGSHRLGYTIQELVKQHGLRRGDASAQMIEAWAKEIDRSARFVKPNMADGEAIIFDGRLWHGTENERQDKRTALLLQYAAADEKILSSRLVPARLALPVPVRATTDYSYLRRGIPGLNEVEKPPALSHSPPTAHVVHVSKDPLEGDPVTGWKPHFIFNGSTGNLEHLTVHASVLSPRCCPHPPHAHSEEEILIVLDGEAVCVISDSAEQSDPRRGASLWRVCLLSRVPIPHDPKCFRAPNCLLDDEVAWTDGIRPLAVERASCSSGNIYSRPGKKLCGSRADGVPYFLLSKASRTSVCASTRRGLRTAR